MCGRFAQTNIIKNTSDIVKSVIGQAQNIDNHNISPGQKAAVIKKYTNGKALEILLWNIIPPWSKNIENFRPLYNTRVESLSKPYFKKISNFNRLVIPCTFYFEWTKSADKKKKPYCFKLKDNEVMFFCGIFDQNEFSILTTEANSENKSIHHRQPLIINKNKINDFLNLKNNINDVIDSIRYPKLDYWEISTLINNPKNNSPDLIKPLNN